MYQQSSGRLIAGIQTQPPRAKIAFSVALENRRRYTSAKCFRPIPSRWGKQCPPPPEACGLRERNLHCSSHTQNVCILLVFLGTVARCRRVGLSYVQIVTQLALPEGEREVYAAKWDYVELRNASRQGTRERLPHLSSSAARSSSWERLTC